MMWGIICLFDLSSESGGTGQGLVQLTDMGEDLLCVQCFCLFSLQIWNITSLGPWRLRNCHSTEKRLTAASFQKKNMEGKQPKRSVAIPALRVCRDNGSIVMRHENGELSSAWQKSRGGGLGV